MDDDPSPAGHPGAARHAWPERRLRSGKDFERIYGQGLRVRNGVFLVICLRNQVGVTRLGLSVSRAQGNAVQRNRMKRVIREAFRKERGVLPEGFDLVVIPKDRRRASRLATAAPALLELLARLAKRTAPGGGPA